ncbi:BZ3500_MvSof-1268-A1-R1_Chr2-2g04995 [Microbotryum saponariae]|uniref:BZ3500_MvSof-1268-A1-R1_Chr2-2g04995 protein n=1 Tax=Microbotryum saponariae TaxID=289078 RepID=A0A2X0L296_9BASI|nr:BZ3500_MvSof-1268-A1-R1_Chr2-2g04995 [Microbotryum saponariae]SDA00664.1 BZ3501_MvSof-1269-A2-R1_Chr2-2g04669 [Microbotryum saponariae]
MPSARTFSQLVRQGCLLSAAVLLVLAVQVSAHDVEESIFQRSGHRLVKRAPVSSVSFKIVTTLPQNVSQCSPLKLKFRLHKSKKKAPALTVLLVDPTLVSSKLRTRTVKLAEISKLSPYQSFTSRDDGESIKFDLMVQEGASFEVRGLTEMANGSTTPARSERPTRRLASRGARLRNSATGTTSARAVRVSMPMRPVATPRPPRIARPFTFTKVVARLTVPPDTTKTRPVRVLSSLHVPSLPYMRGQPGTKATDLRRMQELHRPLRQCNDLLVDQAHILRVRHRGVLEQRSMIENRGVSRAGTCTTRFEVDRIDIKVDWIRYTSSREHA